jgi:DNA-binding beta-propeller fold protein YncE
VSLRREGYIDLPDHPPGGGFDHAAVLASRRRLYVAHTANDAVDVIDLESGAYVESVGELTGVAGALVDEASDLVFTSNRGEDSVSIFAAEDPSTLAKVGVGVRPNGLSLDPSRKTLLAANVGDPTRAGTHTISVIDVAARVMTGSIAVPGRTRWTVFDPTADAFFVNIADPPSIAVIAGGDMTRIAQLIAIPAVGPHGLDVDAHGLLFCASDDGRLLVLEPPGYGVIADVSLAGGPDVIFLDRDLDQLFVAIGDPGVVQVIDISSMKSIQTVDTEPGAHTIALDAATHRVYAFLPSTHRTAVFDAR